MGMSTQQLIVLAVAVVVTAIVFFALGIVWRKKTAEAALGSAEEEAKRVLSDAIKASEAKKKEAVIEAKDEIYRLKQEAEKELKDTEKEMKERRAEVSRQERRLVQKEESIQKIR